MIQYVLLTSVIEMSLIQSFMVEMKEKEKEKLLALSTELKKRKMFQDNETQTENEKSETNITDVKEEETQKEPLNNREEVDKDYPGFESPNILTRFYCHKYLRKKT